MDEGLHMFKPVLLTVIGLGLLLASAVNAAEMSSKTSVVDAVSTGTVPTYSIVLLTENFPPYNMAVDGKNFAPEGRIVGIAAGVGYSSVFVAASCTQSKLLHISDKPRCYRAGPSLDYRAG